MSEEYIPFHKPSIGQSEVDEVVETLRSGWLTTGPRTAQFEREFREYVQSPCALAVNSCTSGLHLAFAALGVGPGDEVITTPLTFCATVNTILQVGATPILADVRSDGNIDPRSVQERTTDRTRAIVPVHLAGLPCDMDAIWRQAQSHGMYVVEDAAHAIGAKYRGVPIGAGDPISKHFSDAVAFSFYATKCLTTGEGGMVTTHDPALARRMKTLCLHGINADAWNRYAEEGSWYYEVTACGFKYNLSDLQAALGLPQLRRQETLLEKRAWIARAYTDALSEVEDLVELPHEETESRHAWHLYIIKLKLDALSAGRNEVVRRLRELKVGASVHFIPIPLHPAYAAHPGLSADHCPKAMQLYRRLISLPIYPDMTSEQVHRVADALKSILKSLHKQVAVSAMVGR
ncbi:MAG TPA: DegT/DnrJ/EryC1/StrS family aminotransferase [Bryobacteraceae bacterium]